MNRSYSKIRHIQDVNLILEQRLLKEEEPILKLTVSKTNDGMLLINGVKYKLQVYKLFGWRDVTVTGLTPKGTTYEITAKLGPVSKTSIVPDKAIAKIERMVNQRPPASLIELGGEETEKRLIKV